MIAETPKPIHQRWEFMQAEGQKHFSIRFADHTDNIRNLCPTCQQLTIEGHCQVCGDHKICVMCGHIIFRPIKSIKGDNGHICFECIPTIIEIFNQNQ